MPLHLALGLALFMLVAGGGVAWWHFADDLTALAARVDAAEGAADAAVTAAEAWASRAAEHEARAETWRARAVAAEQSLELVLVEGNRAPLTAPIRVVTAGGAS